MQWKRVIGWFSAALVFAPMIYLLASLGGALIPASITTDTGLQKKDVRIYLLVGLLHADIAIPATPEILRQFSFLKQVGHTTRLRSF